MQSLFVQIIVTLIVLSVIIPLVYVLWMHLPKLKPQETEALIILGYRCDNDRIHPFLQERLDSALSLWQKGRYQYVIVSGGAVTSIISEAEIMRTYLMENGVPESKIIVEDRSLNTVHNMVNCQILLKQHGLKSGTYISNSFHIRRMMYIAKELNIPASFYAKRTGAEIFRQWELTWKEIRAFRLTLPWIDKAKQLKPKQMMGKKKSSTMTV